MIWIKERGRRPVLHRPRTNPLGKPMRYRAYLLDADETIRFSQGLDAECDAEALEAARPLRGDLTLEIWQVSTTAAWDRLVRRYAGRRPQRERACREDRRIAGG